MSNPKSYQQIVNEALQVVPEVGPADLQSRLFTPFERLGAAVTLRLYPGMGHLVNGDELAIARTVMDRVAQGAG